MKRHFGGLLALIILALHPGQTAHAQFPDIFGGGGGRVLPLPIPLPVDVIPGVMAPALQDLISPLGPAGVVLRNMPIGEPHHVPLTAVSNIGLVTDAIARIRNEMPEASMDAISDAPVVVIKTSETEYLTFLIVPLVSKPLTRTADKSRFEGSIRVALEPVSNNPQAQDLAEAVKIDIVENESATPASIELKKTRSVSDPIVVSSNSGLKPLKLTLRSNVAPQREIEVRVAETLMITPASTSIDGLGFEEVVLTIQALAIENPKDKVVTLKTDKGRLVLPAGPVKLDNTGHASLRLRSDGFGTATVSASLAGGVSDTMAIDFRFPTGTLFASLLGVLAGGGALLLESLTKRPREAWRKRWFRFGASTMFGLIIAGMFVLGVNLLPFQFAAASGALLIFVVSALSAYFGAPLLVPKQKS